MDALMPSRPPRHSFLGLPFPKWCVRKHHFRAQKRAFFHPKIEAKRCFRIYNYEKRKAGTLKNSLRDIGGHEFVQSKVIRHNFRSGGGTIPELNLILISNLTSDETLLNARWNS